MDSTNMLDLHYHHHPEELLLHWNQHPSLNSAERICDEQQQQQQIQHVINPCLSYHMVQDLAKVKHEEETLLLNYNSALPVPTNGSFGFDPSSFGMFLPSSFMPFQTSEQFSRMAPFFDNINYGVQHHLQGQTSARSCITFNEMPGSVNGSKRVAANSSNMDQLKQPKKPRFDSRPSSLSPFKVRKEKLGDRIAALQQLVAPFGKTDTASVLMEAIGYIKFLQDQVETLSVPYIGQSNNRKFHMSLEATDDERDESKPDLRTRGLCLVPLSCTSYVTNDNIVWSPPNFR